MWEYQHSIETTATPQAVWRLWADVENWGVWNADIKKIELRGPFEAGSEITMVPGDGEPVELRLADVVENERFADEARFGDLVLRTTHRVEPLGAGARVVYHMEISGPSADAVGPEIGPAITGDWPETMAALVRLAEGR
ncbi:SRPBCC family protein [Sphaerisporangium fuscum]|uniref:SRPBCC family protein n=1 Tax=Sphaerisporangium fuscum TaxID=2835868 RepID=UPI001BDD1749|nr:SRPBCC family protein [Sphaerisporangium fuscum]